MRSFESRCEPSKRCECRLHGPEVRQLDDATAKRLLCTLSQQIGSEAGNCTIVERASHTGCGHSAKPCAVVRWNVCVVQHDAVGHSEATLQPGGWKCEVNDRRQNVRDVVQSKRRLVRDNACPLRPKPSRDEVLVLASREMD